MTESPVGREPTPQHGRDFWNRLDAAMQQPQHDGVDDRIAATAVLPALARARPEVDRQRRWWPIASAAAVLVVAGIAVVSLRSGTPDSTDVVAAAETSSSAAATLGDQVGNAGSDGESSDRDNTDRAAEPGGVARVDAADDGGLAPVDGAPEAVTDTASHESSGAAETDGSPSIGGAGAAASTTGNGADSPGDRSVEFAVGAVGPALHEPSSGAGNLDDLRFVGSWEAGDVSWYSRRDAATTCHDQRHVELARVNSSGVLLPVADPSPRFSGEIAQFTLDSDGRRIAFVAACERQLELVTGHRTAESGVLDELTTVWVGRGSHTAALVSVVGDTVSLSSIGDDGEPFFVEVDMAARSVSGSGVVGGPDTGGDQVPVGATASGSLTWVNAAADIAGVESCDSAIGWVRRPDGTSQAALTVSEAVGEVGGFGLVALDEASSQVAIANRCPGIGEARVYIGTLRADGLISSLRTIDIGNFGTGAVTALQWTDASTLRIHIDNGNTGGSVARYEWVFDEGREAGFIQALD